MKQAILLIVLAACGVEGAEQDAVTSALATCATGVWCAEPAPPAVVSAGTLLHGVWAASAADVFAVGDGGTILRRVSGAWTLMASGSTANLRGVWGASSADVWAVGLGGAVLRYNGAAWSTVTGVTSSDVDAVWGSSATDVWLAGSGVVTHWNGSAFSSTGFGGAMLSISGTGPSDVWVTGENTNLHHFTGAWATVIPPGAGTSTFFAVQAISPTEVWASDFTPSKETMHLVGGAWTAVRTGSGIWNGMAALGASDVWGAGGSRIGHWTGAAWATSQPLGTAASLWAVAAQPGHVWVVGSGGLIGHLAL
jgi:hypothetical protein